MTKTMSTKDAEKLWGISQRRIIALCQQGKIKGAVKNGRAWEIPFDAEKPMDGRFKTGEYAKSNVVRKLPLPIGISDYRLASTEYYYIDKTLFLKEILDKKGKVNLFTRPRRFGKTLALSMVKTYFEQEIDKAGEIIDNSHYFQNMKIMEAGEKYISHMGQYPVIFLSLKSAKQPDFEMAYDMLKKQIAGEFKRHHYILNADVLMEDER